MMTLKGTPSTYNKDFQVSIEIVSTDKSTNIFNETSMFHRAEKDAIELILKKTIRL